MRTVLKSSQVYAYKQSQKLSKLAQIAETQIGKLAYKPEQQIYIFQFPTLNCIILEPVFRLLLSINSSYSHDYKSNTTHF